MAKSFKSRAHGDDIEMERRGLLKKNDGEDDTDFDHIPARPSKGRKNLEHPHGFENRSFTEQQRQSTDSIEKFRFIVFGHNEDHVDQVCRIILGLAQRGETTSIATCALIDGIVNEQPVSVIKTPFNWLKNFYFSFSRALKSIKNDIEYCQSLIFPGAHAFLLVIEDIQTGKEQRLLRALSEVFGIEALDYCMVLFMKEFEQRDVQKNICVMQCRYRSHILKNTNQSIEELFQKTKEMKRSQKNLTKHLDSFENAKVYFELKFEIERKEWEEKKDKQIEEIEKRYKEDYQKDLEALKLKEKLLKEKFNACQLKHELDISKLTNENEMLRREMKKLKVRMENVEKSDAQETFPCAKVQSESALIEIQEQLQAIKEQLSQRENLERRGMSRERESAQRRIQSSGDIQYEHHSSTAVIQPGASVFKNESKEVIEDDLQASVSQPFAGSKRRNSNEMGKPNMSRNEQTPLQSL